LGRWQYSMDFDRWRQTWGIRDHLRGSGSIEQALTDDDNFLNWPGTLLPLIIICAESFLRIIRNWAFPFHCPRRRLFDSSKMDVSSHRLTLRD
jgi:hypothetical protein